SSEAAETCACGASAGIRRNSAWLRKFIAVQPHTILFNVAVYIGCSCADFMRFSSIEIAGSKSGADRRC
ncbi:hypothetical protein NSP77_26535, partial [Salmonella enterica]|nr:hypothetical protein [Salmonella enterica]